MKVIISITTTFERSHIFYYTIQSLLRQSFKSNFILLNISSSSYLGDSGFKFLPYWLYNDNVIINIVDNIGSYRKLLPALEYADMEDIIVTADDDILYDRCWLENLIEAAISEPDSIVCCRARSIKKNIFGYWQNYSNWILIDKKIKGLDILPTGGSGAAYRKGLLDLDFLSDKMFLHIAPTTDDLWFRMASMRKNIPVAVFPEINSQNIYLLHGFGLEEINLHKTRYKSFISNAFNLIKLKIINYLGINLSKNDFSWDAICKYSQRSEPNNKISQL